MEKKSDWKVIYLQPEDKYIQILESVPISISKTSTVYFGVEKENQEIEIVLKKYTNQIQTSTFDKIKTINSSNFLKPYPQILSMNNNQDKNTLVVEKSASNPKDGCIIIYQYCNQGTLFSILKSEYKSGLTLDQIIGIIGSIIQGYNSIRDKQLFHQNLSLKSIFVNNDLVMIGNIGKKEIDLSSQDDQYAVTWTCPYKIYFQNQKSLQIQIKMPENLEQYKKTQKQKADVYGLGLIFFYLAFGKHPYYNQEFYKTVKQHTNNINKDYLKYLFSKNQQLKKKLEQQFGTSSQKATTSIQAEIKNQKPKQKQKQKKIIRQIQKKHSDLTDFILKMVSINPKDRPDYKSVEFQFGCLTKFQNNVKLGYKNSFAPCNRIQKSNLSQFSKNSKTSIRGSFQSFTSIPKQTANYSTSYTNFLEKALSYKQMMMNKFKGSQQNVRELVEVLLKIRERQTKECLNEQREEILMTSLIGITYNLLMKIKQINRDNYEQIKMVKYLLDCHAIFVTEEVLKSSKGGYKQFNEQKPKGGTQLIKQIKSILDQYSIKNSIPVI